VEQGHLKIMVIRRGKKDLQYLYLFVIINIGGKKNKVNLGRYFRGIR